MKKKTLESLKLAKPLGPYSLGIKIKAQNLVFISGVVAFDAEGNVVGKGDIRAQTKRVLENLKILMEEAGGSLDDIVKLTNYYINYDDYRHIAEIRSQYFKQPFPASTGVEVKRLIHNDLLVEMEAIAVVEQD